MCAWGTDYTSVSTALYWRESERSCMLEVPIILLFLRLCIEGRVNGHVCLRYRLYSCFYDFVLKREWTVMYAWGTDYTSVSTTLYWRESERSCVLEVPIILLFLRFFPLFWNCCDGVVFFFILFNLFSHIFYKQFENKLPNITPSAVIISCISV
jgi:hypothetical protein